MLLKVLKKDFKRKKAMNIILFIFMLTAGTLIASSTNFLYSTVTAVDYFMKISNVADFITLTTQEENITKTIEDWQKSSNKVEKGMSEDAVMLEEKDVKTPDGKVLANVGTVVLMKKPAEYNLIFEGSGKDFEVGPSEAAVPVSVQKEMGLKLGDSILVNVDGTKKEFKVTHVFKDVVFGSQMMSLKRIILNNKDYDHFASIAPDTESIRFWYFTKQTGCDVKDLVSEFSDLLLPTFTLMTGYEIRTTYMMDMVLAAVMIIVSIFLMLISFLILRFTIVFTVMEDYKQIGVMKAIGLKNRKIRGIYSVKYLVLSLVSGAAGFLLSIPASAVMKKNISEFIILQDSAVNLILAFLSVLFVIALTMLFCNYATGKIRKVSAIDAIRQGSTGERFKNSKKLKLHRRPRIRIPLFMALSDIVSDFKKFVILIITFILGTAIIIIPNNVISTLNSDDGIVNFGYSKSDFYIRNVVTGNQDEAEKLLDSYQKDFAGKGINTTLKAELYSMGKAFTTDRKYSVGVMGIQGFISDPEDYVYLEGTAPKLAHEIAVTEKVADYLQVGVGDSILCDMQGMTEELIITALFQTYNNLGNAVRLSQSFYSENGDNTSIQISGLLKGSDKEKKEQIETIRKDFPDLEIKTTQELLDTFIGSITDQMKALEALILLIVLGINFLITTLLLRLMISKEIPEIAILKSLGFHNRSIRLWQIIRIGLVLLFSIIMGTVLANLSGNFLTGGIFKVMGVTRLKLTLEPMQVFVIYPALILAATMSAVLCSLGKIKKTHVWELNNQE